MSGKISKTNFFVRHKGPLEPALGLPLFITCEEIYLTGNFLSRLDVKNLGKCMDINMELVLEKGN